jgi:hypothetical protein
MVLMTYQLPDAIREIAMQGEFNEFDLNVFFEAEGAGDLARFKFEDEVQKWLDVIRGELRETTVDNLKMGAKRPPWPFLHAPLLKVLTHTLWFLPSVAACHAMANLLRQKQNSFYRDYRVIVAAGPEAGGGGGAGPPGQALPPVLDAMDNPRARRPESAFSRPSRADGPFGVPFRPPRSPFLSLTADRPVYSAPGG